MTRDYLIFAAICCLLFIGVHVLLIRMLAERTRAHTVAFPIRRTFLVTCAVMLGFLAGSYWFIQTFENVERDEIQSYAEALVTAYAGTMGPLGFMEAAASVDDSSQASRDRLSRLMDEWRRQHPDIVSIYALTMGKDGQPYFEMNSAAVTGGFRIGDRRVYTGSTPELKEAFLGQSGIQRTPTLGMLGYRVRAFSPIRSSGGSVIGVLGMDLEGTMVKLRLHRERMKGMSILLVPLALILGLYGIVVRARSDQQVLQKKKSQLELSQARYRILSDANVEGMIIHKEGRILEVNRALAEMLGYRVEAMVGKSAFDLTPKEESGKLRSRIGRSGKDSYELVMQRKDGSLLTTEVHVNTFIYNGSKVRAAAVRDVTERKRQEETIRYMAYHDDLTGLPNKKRFADEVRSWIGQDVDSGRKAALLFMDLNKFKQINDTFGHAAGDQAMKECCALFEEALGGRGMLARWEADEFAVWLPELQNTQEALDVAGRLVNAMNAPVAVKGVAVRMGISIGISLYPDDGRDEETLLRKADTAMFSGKRSVDAKPVHFYDYRLQQTAEARLLLERELLNALELGQFELHYQPQVLIRSGAIVGVEALIRWKHPEKGYISPGEFIPLAEETGLIMPIGDWVLRRACEDMKRLEEGGTPALSVAVNLSAFHFSEEGLAEKVRKVLEETGLSPRQLELEITETMMMDPEHALTVLHQLKALGIRISIDDFGTGYSSLHYLNRFPIDKLKIDRSFVNDLQNGDEPITAAIISLARNMRLQLIAEGVETARQAEILLDMGCPQAQGFHYYKPMSREGLEFLLRRHAAVEWNTAANGISVEAER